MLPFLIYFTKWVTSFLDKLVKRLYKVDSDEKITFAKK